VKQLLQVLQKGTPKESIDAAIKLNKMLTEGKVEHSVVPPFLQIGFDSDCVSLSLF
jgi:hypothetical protein